MHKISRRRFLVTAAAVVGAAPALAAAWPLPEKECKVHLVGRAGGEHCEKCGKQLRCIHEFRLSTLACGKCSKPVMEAVSDRDTYRYHPGHPDWQQVEFDDARVLTDPEFPIYRIACDPEAGWVCVARVPEGEPTTVVDGSRYSMKMFQNEPVYRDNAGLAGNT